MAIALVSGQDVIYQLHGHANLAGKEAANQGTLFEIGSVSKPLTALAVLAQVQAGHWQLDQPLAAQFPISDLTTHQYTLADLLTHRSGLPRLPANLPLDDLRNPYAGYHEKHLLAALSDNELVGKATVQPFNYSNYGYGLLGWLLATSQQQSYANVMQQHVFPRLGMLTAQVATSNAARDPADAATTQPIAGLAQGYAIDGTPVDHWQFDSLAGAGAVVASITDMAAMLHNIFANATHDTLLQHWLTNLTAADAPVMTPGWMRTEQGWFWHAGQTAGFSSVVIFDTQQQKGLVILTNIGIPVTEQGLALFRDWLSTPATDSQTHVNLDNQS